MFLSGILYMGLPNSPCSTLGVFSREKLARAKLEEVETTDRT